MKNLTEIEKKIKWSKYYEFAKFTKNRNSEYYAFWFYISARTDLSFEFIEEFKENILWNTLFVKNQFSENFLTKFKKYYDDITWQVLWSTQVVSEKFIRKHFNYIIWSAISQYQNLSEEFIYEFQRYIWFNNLLKNKNYSENFKIFLKNKYSDKYFRLENNK